MNRSGQNRSVEAEMEVTFFAGKTMACECGGAAAGLVPPVMIGTAEAVRIDIEHYETVSPERTMVDIEHVAHRNETGSAQGCMAANAPIKVNAVMGGG
jgi:hypothetical protein